MRSDSQPRGPEEGSAEMVSFGRWQGRPGLPGGGECWCRPPAPPRLASAPCTGCCQACQPSPSSLTSCATSSSTRAGTTHRVDQCMVAHHHHHPPTTTLQLSLTDVWNEVWRRRIQHPPSGAGASWCVRLETSTICQYNLPANNTSWLVQCVTHEISWHSPQSWDHQSRNLANIFSHKRLRIIL